MPSTVWMKVQDVANRALVAVPPQASLRVAAGLMDENSVGALVVTTDRGAVGILSERDVVAALAAGAHPDEATVAGAMSISVVSVRPHDTLYDAAVDMLDLGIRHVPVMDERGRALGMVSIRDLIRPLLTASFTADA